MMTSNRPEPNSQQLQLQIATAYSTCLASWLIALLVLVAPLPANAFANKVGVLEGYDSSSKFDDPATRTLGFEEWLQQNVSFAGCALDFNHWSGDGGYFFGPFNSSFQPTAASRRPLTLTLQMPLMFNSDSTKTNWQDAAAGVYDPQINATLFALCNTFQYCDAFIRPMWEFNGNWYPWNAATNTTAWIAYFRRIVHIARAVPNQNYTIVWNTNAMRTDGDNSLNPPWQAWPGDEYVDVVATDVYDQSWAAYPTNWYVNLTQNQIEALQTKQASVYVNGEFGLNDHFAFARLHKKPFGIAEWGLKSRDNHGGGDNIIYVQAMNDWMTRADVAPYLLFHSWYDEEDSVISQAPLNPDNKNFPYASLLYRKLFGKAAAQGSLDVKDS